MIKSRMMRWAGHGARMGDKRNTYSILLGKPEGKRPMRRPRRRSVDNIKMDLRYDRMIWIGMICCEHDNEPAASIKCREDYE
jgi:hypothetical protein